MRSIASSWTSSCTGGSSAKASRSTKAVIERMKTTGCDAVVLGCTEIPLIIDDSRSALPTLDSTRLLARAAVERSLVDR